MKKILCLCACILSAGFMVFAKPFVPANHQAVVSISANDYIDWYGDEASNTGVVNVINRSKINNEATDDVKAKLGYTGYLLNDMKAAVFDSLSEYGLNLVPEEEVLNSEAYKAAAENKMKKAALFVSPEGYKLFGPKDKAYAGIVSETGSEGLVSVFFDVKKTMNNGIGKNGSMKACATVSIEFIDPTGKTLKTFNGYASSEEAIKVAGGIYDTEALSVLYPAVIKAAMEAAVSKIK